MQQNNKKQTQEKKNKEKKHVLKVFSFAFLHSRTVFYIRQQSATIITQIAIGQMWHLTPHIKYQMKIVYMKVCVAKTLT